MPYDENWPRWIISSIDQWFDQNKGSFELFAEGGDRKTNAAPEWIELRVDGPYSLQPTKDFWRHTVDVNILISVPVDADQFHVDRAIGFVNSIIPTSIGVYKYGDGTPDDQSYVGCLQLQRNSNMTQVTRRYGQVETNTRLMQASVAFTYLIEIP